VPFISHSGLKPIVQIVTVGPSALLVKFVGALLNLLLNRDQDGRLVRLRCDMAEKRTKADKLERQTEQLGKKVDRYPDEIEKKPLTLGIASGSPQERLVGRRGFVVGCTVRSVEALRCPADAMLSDQQANQPRGE
jgi:hypothetical protein